MNPAAGSRKTFFEQRQAARKQQNNADSENPASKRSTSRPEDFIRETINNQ